MIYSAIKNFFYSFIPKILKGARDDEVYSATRVGMLGSLTQATIVSMVACLTFVYYKQYEWLFWLVIAWLSAAILLALFLGVRGRDRAKLVEDFFNLIEKRFDKK